LKLIQGLNETTRVYLWHNSNNIQVDWRAL
jgi:hypothetical protein